MQRLANRVALMHGGRMLLAGTTDEILDRVDRVRVVLSDGAAPPPLPAGVLQQQRTGCEWLLKVDRFDPAMINGPHERPEVAGVDVLDLNLDDVFKDIVRGNDEATS